MSVVRCCARTCFMLNRYGYVRAYACTWQHGSICILYLHGFYFVSPWLVQGACLFVTAWWAVKTGHGAAVNWNWGAIPMDASQKKRPPAKAHRLLCNVDLTTILNWLSTDQCLFAHQEVDVLEARGIVHKDGAEHLNELIGNSICSPTRRRAQGTGHGARQW